LPLTAGLSAIIAVVALAACGFCLRAALARRSSYRLENSYPTVAPKGLGDDPSGIELAKPSPKLGKWSAYGSSEFAGGPERQLSPEELKDLAAYYEPRPNPPWWHSSFFVSH
jgi:hypothetical protein